MKLPVVATALASLFACAAAVIASEECWHAITTNCENQTLACVQNCLGRTIQNLAYIDAQDSGLPYAEALADDPTARGIMVDYPYPERLLVNQLPLKTEWLYISNVHLSASQRLSIPQIASLHALYLTGANVASAARLKLPTTVSRLTIIDSSLTSLSGVQWPDALSYLDVSRNHIRSLDDVAFPGKMKKLNMSENTITAITNFAFPSSIEILSLAGNGLSSIANVTFPTALKTLDLAGNCISTISLTTAQWKTFQAATTATVALEGIPSSTKLCTTGRFTGGSDSAMFAACLMPS